MRNLLATSLFSRFFAGGPGVFSAESSSGVDECRMIPESEIPRPSAEVRERNDPWIALITVWHGFIVGGASVGLPKIRTKKKALRSFSSAAGPL